MGAARREPRRGEIPEERRQPLVRLTALTSGEVVSNTDGSNQLRKFLISEATGIARYGTRIHLIRAVPVFVRSKNRRSLGGTYDSAKCKLGLLWGRDPTPSSGAVWMLHPKGGEENRLPHRRPTRG
jgi:hypothetical protein